MCNLFDLIEAFDSIPHQLLLDVLFSLDISHHLIVWLQSYLTFRSQQVVVDGCSSSKSTVLSGVPQGSILGPSLFILYVNDIFQYPFSSTSSIILYADDILLSCPFKSSFEFSLAQSNINILSSWVKSKQVTINHSKTKYMIISRKSPPPFTTLPSLFLDESPLELVSSFKYLGFTLTSNLSWSTHINETCSKAKKLLGYIYCQFYHNSSSSVLIKLYLTLILPILMYSSSVWDPYSISNINKLEKVQHFALKLCSKNWTSDYPLLLQLFNLPSLSSCRTTSKFVLLYKFIISKIYISAGSFLFQKQSSYNLRSSHPLNPNLPFSRSSATFNSFLPSAISLWNSLLSSFKDLNPARQFKQNISYLL